MRMKSFRVRQTTSHAELAFFPIPIKLATNRGAGRLLGGGGPENPPSSHSTAMSRSAGSTVEVDVDANHAFLKWATTGKSINNTKYNRVRLQCRVRPTQYVTITCMIVCRTCWNIIIHMYMYQGCRGIPVSSAFFKFISFLLCVYYSPWFVIDHLILM